MYLLQRWDRSYFLEDLSGLAIDCDMVGAPRWNFTNIINDAAMMGTKITPLYGSSPNEGRTEPAMIKILDNMNGVSAILSSFSTSCVFFFSHKYYVFLHSNA